MSAAEFQEENLTPAITRPESPSSSVDMNDVDWNFAKREAAFARLGLDPALDNLPDEELNKLYEKITRVKALRSVGPRPESSLSQADDVWSESGRPLPSDILTDDTSVDAMTNDNSPEMAGSMREMQSQLETQRVEFEQRLQAISEYSEADDLKAEKQQMEHQLKLVQVHMKRLLDARARGETDLDAVPFEPVIYPAMDFASARSARAANALRTSTRACYLDRLALAISSRRFERNTYQECARRRNGEERSPLSVNIAY